MKKIVTAAGVAALLTLAACDVNSTTTIELPADANATEANAIAADANATEAASNEAAK